MPQVYGEYGAGKEKVKDHYYGNVPSTVNEYSKGIGNTTVANQQGEQLDQDGANWAAVLGNQIKMVPELLTEIVPMGTSMIPMLTPFTGAETWSDWWEGQKYAGPTDFYRSIQNTKLSMDDNVGMNGFVKISKNQNHEEFGQAISGLLGRQIDADTIFNWVLPEAKKQGFDVETRADAEKLFGENQEFNSFVNSLIDQIQSNSDYDPYMVYGRDWFQDKDNYYIKNFKEMPGVNVAWTKDHNDLSMPGLGILKIDDDGQGRMLRKSPMSWEGIPGMEQLQEKGYWGPDTSAMGEEGFYKYNLPFDGDNPATQIWSQVVGVPASIATGNIKNIMHLPNVAKNISTLKALKTRPTRPVWSKPLGEGMDFSPQSGIVKETAKNISGLPGLWAAKKPIGIMSVPALYGAYGPDWP